MKPWSRVLVAAVLVAVVVLPARAASAAGGAGGPGDDVIERVLAVAAGTLVTQSDVAAASDLGLIQVAQSRAGGAQVIMIGGR